VSNARVQARQYVTAVQVAADLGVNQSKVLGWIHRGELRAINVAARLGGRPRWRISREAVDAFLAARTVQPAAAPPRRRRRADPEVIQFF
jgi:excisionase family DNA binding protein